MGTDFAKHKHHNMNTHFLICTDLDRTLLPNGEQAESPDARQRFARLAQHPSVHIAYVTGRHRQLVLEAIEQYQVPIPNYIIGDVGSSIYEIKNNDWQQWQAWHDEIKPDWHGSSRNDLERLFSDIRVLRLQELEKQNTFKLSYYTPLDTDSDQLCEILQARLKQHNILANLIWSVDELKQVGLLDVLPKSANKLHAIEFLMQHKGYSHKGTVFAGDSGNDLTVLCSHIQSVLVANAPEDVRKQALTMAADNGYQDALYLARGDFLGMNGNYAAGILEGVTHFIPEIAANIGEIIG